MVLGVRFPHGAYCDTHHRFNSYESSTGNTYRRFDSYEVNLSPCTIGTSHMVYGKMVVPPTRYQSTAEPYVGSQVVEVPYVGRGLIPLLGAT